MTRVAAAVRERRGEDWVLLAWVIPFFLITGWFEVKFPRYLLPIYPLMILWAAEWLVRKYRERLAVRPRRLCRWWWRRHAGGRVCLHVHLYPAAHGGDRLRVGLSAHSARGARSSRRTGTKAFRSRLPGATWARIKSTSSATTSGRQRRRRCRSSARQLASSRLHRLPDEAPLRRGHARMRSGATRYAAPADPKYFYELFAGDLGYTLIQEVASRPSLVRHRDSRRARRRVVDGVRSSEGLDLPEHRPPRRPATIFDKIMRGYPSKPLTRDDILLARPGSETSVEPRRPAPPDPLQRAGAAPVCACSCEVLGLATFPLLRRWLTGCPDVWRSSKTLGVLLFAYVSWLLVSLGRGELHARHVDRVVAVLALLGAVRLAARRGQRVPLTRGRDRRDRGAVLGRVRRSSSSSRLSTRRSSGARSRWTSRSSTR